jgi:hypothetical protein
MRRTTPDMSYPAALVAARMDGSGVPRAPSAKDQSVVERVPVRQ